MSIAIATSAAEREAVCALRYRVYADEQGRAMPGADYRGRLDLSADDASGVIFTAHVGGVLAGTVRVHHGATTDLPPFVRCACRRPEAEPLPTVAVISRLTIDPAHRGGQTVVTMLRACNGWLVADGRLTRELFILALDIPRPIALYGALGFKPLEPVTRHESEIGPVVSMRHMPARRPDGSMT